MKLDCGCYIDQSGKSIGKCAHHAGRADEILGDDFRWTGKLHKRDKARKLSAVDAYHARMSKPMRDCVRDGQVRSHRQSEGGP